MNNDIREKLNDIGWLIHQHHFLKKSLKKIARELCISPATVTKYIRLSNVEEINHSILPNSRKLLNDKDWLIKQHLENNITLNKIASSLNVGVNTVIRYLKYHNITIIDNRILPKTRQLLNDVDWISNQHINEGKSCAKIAKELCVDPSTVIFYLKKHKIDHFIYRIDDHNSIKLLNDKDWLVEQHLENKRTLTDIALSLNVAVMTVSVYCKKHKIDVVRLPSSKEEDLILSFVKSKYHGTVIKGDRKIVSPKELDILLPDLNVAIEINGAFWHSELQGKNKKYHLEKTKKCSDNNIHLLHFWDYEINEKLDIIKSMILHKLKKTDNTIYARKCVIEKITNDEAFDFHNQNHLQGYSTGTHVGLKYNNRLVALLTYGKSRFNKKYDHEIIRYSSLNYHSIIGGFGKLLKQLPKGMIVSYADRRYSVGNVYEILGFTLHNISAPNYKYTKNHKTFYSRNKFQKHKLEKLLDKFDENLSEWENMKMNGYDRIWDCGNLVYVLNNRKDK
jgi:DNA-binding CsgD family transcriptional regulator